MNVCSYIVWLYVTSIQQDLGMSLLGLFFESSSVAGIVIVGIVVIVIAVVIVVVVAVKAIAVATIPTRGSWGLTEPNREREGIRNYNPSNSNESTRMNIYIYLHV